MDWYKLMVIVIGALLVENFVLSKFLGYVPFLGYPKSFQQPWEWVVHIFVMTIASGVTRLLYDCLLVPFGLGYLQTIAFILVIAALVQLVEVVLKDLYRLFTRLWVLSSLITTNCAVLGVALLNIEEGYNFVGIGSLRL